MIFFADACGGYRDDGVFTEAFDCEQVTWVTSDGVDWVMNHLDPGVFGDPFSDSPQPAFVTSHAGGFVAVAWAHMVWTSTDGAAWGQIDLPPDAQPRSIVTAENAVIIGGTRTLDDSHGRSEPAIWILITS